MQHSFLSIFTRYKSDYLQLLDFKHFNKLTIFKHTPLMFVKLRKITTFQD